MINLEQYSLGDENISIEMDLPACGPSNACELVEEILDKPLTKEESLEDLTKQAQEVNWRLKNVGSYFKKDKESIVDGRSLLENLEKHKIYYSDPFEPINSLIAALHKLREEIEIYQRCYPENNG